MLKDSEMIFHQVHDLYTDVERKGFFNKDGDEIAKILYVAYLTPGFHRDPILNVTKGTHSPNKAKSKFLSTYTYCTTKICLSINYS